MSHYDGQISAHNEDVAKKRRKELQKRLKNVTKDMTNNELESFIIAGAKWDDIVSLLELIKKSIA